MAQTIGSLDLASLKNLRDDVTQYFWFESNSSSAWGSGAHVTLYPESQFTDSTSPNYMKGQNIIMNTDGFSIRNGGLPMMVLDNNSLDFNVVDTAQGTYTTMATFGLSGMRTYSRDSANNLVQLANIGYGEGQAQTGTAIAPYYTLGTRASNSVIGNYSMAEGYNTTASAYVSHAEGSSTVASHRGSHAEGIQTTASGDYAHAEGAQTTASGEGSHAEGNGTTASYKYSHAEGKDTTAGGNYAHAEGSGTSAYQWCHAEGRETSAHGNASHAQNSFTIAKRRSQTAIGEYNIADTSGVDGSARGDYVLIIGNGNGIPNDPNERSNALTVDWSGNVVASGSIISDTDYDNAWNHSDKGYTVRVSSLAGSTYLGQEIRLEKVSSTNKHPIFNGFDISGTGTARIHTLAHYIYQSTYNNESYWTAYIKMRNDNTSAINNFDVTAYIAWM